MCVVDGVFASHAPRYAAHGLAVIPTGGDKGKRPLIRNWQKPISAARLDSLCRNHGSANLAVHAGHSGLVIVDIDDPDLIGGAIARFGKSPVQTRTPSGGAHLWFRANGESRKIKLENQPIDILAGDSLLVAPPSRRPDGGSYRFEQGGLEDIEHLPKIRSGALPEAPIPAKDRKTRQRHHPKGQGRNSALFKAVKDFALGSQVTSLDQVLECAMGINREFAPPLPDYEAAKVAGSVWKMKSEGRLFGAKNPGLFIPQNILEIAIDEGRDVLMLLIFLRNHNFLDSTGFPIALKGVSERLSMRKTTVARARNRIIDRGIIQCIHQGGKRPGDVSISKWNKKALI